MCSYTFQGFKVRRTFLVCAWSIDAAAFPVAPVCNVFQPFAVSSVLKVLGVHQAGTPAGVNEVVKFDDPSAAILAGPGGGNRTSWAWGIIGTTGGIVRNKLDLGDLGCVKRFDATGGGVLEKQLIAFRSDNVPSVFPFAASCNEVGI